MEKIIDKKIIYESKYGRFELVTVELPNGKRVKREWYARPPGVFVLALDGQGGLLMTREYRSAAARIQWDLPRGMMEKGETPREAAARELREETGTCAKRFTVIHHEQTTSEAIKGEAHFVVAEGLYECGKDGGDEDYEIEVIPTTLQEAFRLAFDEVAIEPPLVIKALLILRKWLREQGRTA